MKNSFFYILSICLILSSCSSTGQFSRETSILSNYFEIEETSIDQSIRISSIGTFANWEGANSDRMGEAKFILYIYNTAEQDYFINITSAKLIGDSAYLDFISEPREIRLIHNSVERLILTDQPLNRLTKDVQLSLELTTPAGKPISKLIPYVQLSKEALRKNREIKKSLKKL